MRIDIIHMRDPDSSCEHEVYIDGKPASGDLVVEFHEFDPGCGWEAKEIDTEIAAHVENAPEFLRDRIAQIYANWRSTYEKWSY